MLESIFGVNNIVDAEVESAIKSEIEELYSDIDPNAEIAEQFDSLSDFNFGLIDGVPAQALLPIIADELRNFDLSAELYAIVPDNDPYQEGQLELVVNSAAINQAKNIYNAGN